MTTGMQGLQGLPQTYPLEEVFNTMSRKLLVYVMSAKGITKAGLKGPPDVFCKVSLGKDSHKTHTIKKTNDPDFGGELLLFRLDGNAELTFELRDKTNALKDEFLGIASITNIESKFKPNVVYDERIELGGRTKSKANKKPDAVSGTLFFRIMWSEAPETRPDSAIDDHLFFYEEHIPNIKTGDLLAYDGFGFVSSYVKLASNSQFSHVGMVVQLPNKWTRKLELYVIEVTRNIDLFLDAFKETPLTKANINVFRLFERLHHVHASNVWLIPANNYSQVSPEFQVVLNALVNNQTQLHAIVKEIIPDTYAGGLMNESTCAVPGLCRYTKKVFGKQRSPYIFQEMFGYVREIYTTATMIKLSRSLGRHHQPSDSRMVFPVEFILNPSLFRTPILLRTLKERQQVPANNNATLRGNTHVVANQQPQTVTQVVMVAQHVPMNNQTMRYSAPAQGYPQSTPVHVAQTQTMRTGSGQYQPHAQPVQIQQPQGYPQQGQYPPSVQYPQQPSQYPTAVQQQQSYAQQPPQYGAQQQSPQQYPSNQQPQQYSSLVSPPSYPQQSQGQYPSSQSSYSSFSSPPRDSNPPQPNNFHSTPNLPSYSSHAPSYSQRDSSDMSTISVDDPKKEQVYHNRNTFATMRASEDDVPKGMSYPDLFSPDGFAMNLPSVPTTVPTRVQQESKPQRSSGSLIPG